MGIFGWSYPPGAESHPFAPYNQPDPLCELCGVDPSDCQCPACGGCQIVGVPLADGLCSTCRVEDSVLPGED